MMQEAPSPFEELLSRLDLNQIPSLQRILASMDPIAWTLVLLLLGAVALGIVFTINTRHTFLKTDEVEATPEVLLARLKQDPMSLSPVSIINRLGAEATLELLRYGDQITATEWRFKWSSVREELLHLLSQQNAFGPIHALARYYESDSEGEPDSLRVRRTVLIHKLGQRRFLDPAPDGSPAQLRLRRHPAEQIGNLGFYGPTIWLDGREADLGADGPLIEMSEVHFRTVNEAGVHLRIQRTPTVGGGFYLHLLKRRKMWIVADETIEWTL
ncbi:MAG: hypothetical protein KDD84_12950 [Caldilineaceae bacterium]|nr:hypothetical protein [Caldilineaceae bacterium]